MALLRRILIAVIGGLLPCLLGGGSAAYAQGSPGTGIPGGDAIPPTAPRDAGAPQGDGAAPPPPSDPAAPPEVDAPPEPLPSGTDDANTPEAPAKIPARMGRVQGTVVDAQTGEPLIEAQVTVVKTGKKVLTDIDGNYKIDLPPGVYDLRMFAELKPARKIANVKVELGKATHVDVALGSGDDKIAVQEIEVVAAPDTATEAVQIVQRQKAAVVSDGVSAQQISRSPDTSASDSIKRVVAATVQDNRYVIIRGLGGRYSNTLLNGVNLPSPDPDTPAAPLDLFPAVMLANLTVAKTFSPDMPGNFAGGILLINTRDFPSKFMLSLRATGSADTASTYRKSYTHNGGNLDFLGYDDGSRALPSGVPNNRLLTDPTFTPEQVAARTRTFPNDWQLRNTTLGPNYGFAATAGNTIGLGSQKLGYLATVNYGRRFARRLIRLQRLGEKLREGTFLPSTEQLEEDRATDQPNLGGLITLGYAPSPAHRINLTSLYTHNTENMTSRTLGIEDSGQNVDRMRLRFLEREMLAGQLLGEHAFAAGRVVLAWQGNLADTRQNEPGARDLVRTASPMGWSIGNSAGAAEKTYGTLSDRTGGGGLDLSFLLDGSKLKAGANVTASSRDYLTRRFHYDVSTDLATLPSDRVFSPDNVGRGLSIRENTLGTDGYTANRATWATYVMADIVKLDPFRLIVGERLEISNLEVNVGNKVDAMLPPPVATRKFDRDLLPSVNAVLAVSKDSNARLGYSRTIARPHFREVAPALFFDYVRRRAIGGNENLKRTSIQNLDLRWETFIGPTELLAISTFYKRFTDPIERTVDLAGSGTNVGFINARGATAYGFELEARTSLGRLANALRALTLSGNLSVIQSRIDIPGENRPLQGQSPYVLNFDLGYFVERTHTQLDALYNVFGRRIDEVGAGKAPNRTPDIYEEPFHRVDLTLNQRLPASFSLKLSVTNVLDQRVVLTQSDIEILAYKPGVGFFGTLEWSIRE
jgi:outer membrane receptor protein involved in Fe transport